MEETEIAEGTEVSTLLKAALRTYDSTPENGYAGPTLAWPITSWRHPPRTD